jgi:ATP-dependent DNA helicase RecG
MAVATKANRAKKAVQPDLSLLEQKFKKLGLLTDEDFLMHLPLRYEDETKIMPIAEIRPGFTAQIEGEVLRSDISLKPRKQLIATLSDESATVSLRWLTFYPSQQLQMKPGKRWRVRGEVRTGYHGLEIIHPKVTACGSPLSTALTPVYASTEGLTQTSLRKAIANSMSRVTFHDTLPQTLINKLGLQTFEQALRTLHAPTPDIDQEALLEHTHPAWLRVKFDEL